MIMVFHVAKLSYHINDFFVYSRNNLDCRLLKNASATLKSATHARISSRSIQSFSHKNITDRHSFAQIKCMDEWMLTRQWRANQMTDALSEQHQSVRRREVIQRHQFDQQTRGESERGCEKQPKRTGDRHQNPVVGNCNRDCCN